jgi:hypothetical protein
VHVPWAPGAIFGIMCLIVAFLMLLLPETAGHELPQNIEELRTWYKDNAISQTKNKNDNSVK